MKVAPVAQGSGVPGQSLDTAGVSVDRKAAAKAAFLGETTVQPSDTYVDPQIAKAQENIRKLKMRTNASTNRHDPGMQAEPLETETTLEAQSGISDASVETEVAPEVTKPLSPQFAALARQKRALQVKEGEIRQREEALKNRETQGDGGEVLNRLKTNPLGVLQEAGVTYDQLTEAILSNGSGNSEIQSLKAEINALKEGVNKTFTDRDVQAEKQVLAEMRRDVDKVAAQGDEYELIRETQSQAEVIDLIHRTYKKTGEILDTREAMGLVEEELLLEGEKIARIKKIQGRLTPAEEVVEALQTQRQQPRQMRTLTNRDGAKAPLTARERAIAAFHGTTKR